MEQDSESLQKQTSEHIAYAVYHKVIDEINSAMPFGRLAWELKHTSSTFRKMSSEEEEHARDKSDFLKQNIIEILDQAQSWPDEQKVELVSALALHIEWYWGRRSREEDEHKTHAVGEFINTITFDDISQSKIVHLAKTIWGISDFGQDFSGLNHIKKSFIRGVGYISPEVSKELIPIIDPQYELPELARTWSLESRLQILAEFRKPDRDLDQPRKKVSLMASIRWKGATMPLHTSQI